MKLNGTESLSRPPAADEIEISVFGPGYGECIVVHLGSGDWITVDSCIDPASKQPVALSYFESIGIDPASAVRSVIATHWDDDHIGGLADLFSASVNAKFCCSSAMSSKEFQTLLSSWRLSNFLPGGSGIDEFERIMREIKRRKNNTPFPNPAKAAENTLLWEREDPPRCRVLSLSPSAAAEMAAIARLTEIATLDDRIRRRIPKIESNHASVVLSIRVENLHVLLGGDLQVREDRSFGWFAVVDAHGGGRNHDVFKISHHGSHNGDSPEIWEKMIKSDAIAIIAPFVGGDVRLPTAADCKRIISDCEQSFVTAPPRPKKFSLTDKTAEKTIREAAKQIHFAPGRFGQVRIRRKISEEAWSIELFGDAISLRDLLSKRLI